MQKLLTYADIGESAFEVRAGSKVLGNLFMLEDGFYQFFAFGTLSGYIPAHILREIADKLDELNKDWQAIIDTELNKRGLLK